MARVTGIDADQQKWQSRIVGSGVEKPDQLLANPLNWRVHPKHQQEALMALLDKIGWVQQIIVNKRTDRVVDGHLRVALAMRRDEQEVPVLYIDLSEDEEKLVLATLDPIAALASADKEQLALLLGDVADSSDDLAKLLSYVARKYGAGLEALSSETRGALDSLAPCRCPLCGNEHFTVRKDES